MISKRFGIYVGSLSLIALLLSSCAVQPRGILDCRNVLKTAPTVRVALVTDEPGASIGVSGPFTAYSLTTGAALMTAPGLSPCRAQAASGGIWLGGNWLAAREVRIICERDAGANVNGRYYRGQLILRNSGASLTVLNTLDMERYLAGVVGSEAVETWPDDALRAQAVVARTYALYKLKASSAKAFDVAATTDDQVYLGAERETAKLRRIVKETAGIAVLYKDKVFPTYFHSTCAGHTEEVSRALKYESIPPLRGVPCNYCRDSKYYGWWTVNVDVEALSALMRRNGRNVGQVTNVEPLDIGPSQRALRVRVTGTAGTTVMNAYDFRKLVGASQIRNTYFIVRNYGSYFQFLGRGWGHGVGMCQFGAKGMADKGYGFAAILRHYYPGADLARLY